MAVLELFVSKAAAPPISPALSVARGEFAWVSPTIVQAPSSSEQGFTPLHRAQWLKWVSWKKDGWQQMLVRSLASSPKAIYYLCNIKGERTKGSAHARGLEVEEWTWI